MPNTSQVKFKKTEVEEHHRISSISNQTKSVTACNDSLNSRTSNVNAVCATCRKCVFNSNHDACVSKFLNDVNARTKKPTIVPISTRKLKNLVQGNIIINRVYYVEGLNHNLFLVGQFYDADLEVAFWKSTCFVKDLQGNDLLTGNRGTDLYTISLQETTSSTLICLMAKASPTQAWLWHRRLSHLNFDYINLLSKKDVVISLPKLKYVKDQLCSFKAIKTIGTEFLNKTLNAFFKEEGIEHQTSTPRPPDRSAVGDEILDKMKEKGDSCILVGYSTQSKGYRVYNKRTRLIVESIHLRFDEFKEMSETSVANVTSGLVPQRQKVSDYEHP
ncbi:retrovirus-related pol polyprotein from transposon TNT 1-94 [Tanacetum coccineum]